MQASFLVNTYGCVLTSPLQRTVETAIEIAAKLGLPLKVVLGLSECAMAIRGRVGSTKFLSDNEVGNQSLVYFPAI